MPETFLVDTQGKMEEWQGVAILPIPNPSRVIRAVTSLNLPIEYLAQYNPIPPYEINRLLTQNPRRNENPQRGRGRGNNQSRGRGTNNNNNRGRGRSVPYRSTFM